MTELMLKNESDAATVELTDELIRVNLNHEVWVVGEAGLTAVAEMARSAWQEGKELHIVGTMRFMAGKQVGL